MIIFFTTIGIGSSIAALKKGGKLLVIFWLLSGVMTFMQTVIGVGVAKVTNIHPYIWGFSWFCWSFWKNG